MKEFPNNKKKDECCQMKDMWMLLSSLQSPSLGLVKLKSCCYEGEDWNIACLCRFFSLPGLFGQLWTHFSCFYWVNQWRRYLDSNVVFTMILVLILQTHPGVHRGWLVFTVSFFSTSFTSHCHMDRHPRTVTSRSLWCSEHLTMPRFPWELFCTAQDPLELTSMTIWHTSPPPQRLCLLTKDL